MDSYSGKGRRDNRPDLYEDEDEELNENGEIIDFGYQNNEPNDDGQDLNNVDFLFVDPDPNQFHAIKGLVNGILDGESFKSSDLAEAICNQVVVGSMITIEDDEEQQKGERSVFGFGTILNAKYYSELDFMKELLNYIFNKSEIHNPHHADLEKILKGELEHVGLVINERIINLSPQLVPLLHNQVCEDIKWVIQEKKEEAPLFELKYLVFLSKCYKEINFNTTKKKNQGPEDFIYQKFEDYAFVQKAPMKFVFDAKSSKDNAGLTSVQTNQTEQQCLRMVYVMTFEDYYKTVQELPNYLVNQ